MSEKDDDSADDDFYYYLNSDAGRSEKGQSAAAKVKISLSIFLIISYSNII